LEMCAAAGEEIQRGAQLRVDYCLVGRGAGNGGEGGGWTHVAHRGTVLFRARKHAGGLWESVWGGDNE